MEKRIMVSKKEIHRGIVLEKVSEGVFTLKEGSELMKIIYRQAIRLVNDYRSRELREITPKNKRRPHRHLSCRPQRSEMGALVQIPLVWRGADALLLAANEFLPAFFADFRKRFAVPPAGKESCFIPITKQEAFDTPQTYSLLEKTLRL